MRSLRCLPIVLIAGSCVTEAAAAITPHWRVNPITPAAIAAVPHLANARSVSLVVDLTGGSLFHIAGMDVTGLGFEHNYYQDPLGTTIAPNPVLFASFPALEFDTYVTTTLGAAQTPWIPGRLNGTGAVLVGNGAFNVGWGASPNSGPLGGTSLEIARITVFPTGDFIPTLVDGQVRDNLNPNIRVPLPPYPFAYFPEPAEAAVLASAGLLLRRRRPYRVAGSLKTTGPGRFLKCTVRDCNLAAAACVAGLASAGQAAIAPNWRINQITPAAIVAEPALAGALSVSLVVDLTGTSLFNVAGIDLTGLIPGLSIYNHAVFSLSATRPSPVLVLTFPDLEFDSGVRISDPAMNVATAASVPGPFIGSGPALFGPDTFNVVWGATPNSGPVGGTDLEIARITFLGGDPSRLVFIELTDRAVVRDDSPQNVVVPVPPMPTPLVPEPTVRFRWDLCR